MSSLTDAERDELSKLYYGANCGPLGTTSLTIDPETLYRWLLRVSPDVQHLSSWPERDSEWRRLYDVKDPFSTKGMQTICRQIGALVSLNPPEWYETLGGPTIMQSFQQNAQDPYANVRYRRIQKDVPPDVWRMILLEAYKRDPGSAAALCSTYRQLYQLCDQLRIPYEQPIVTLREATMRGNLGLDDPIKCALWRWFVFVIVSEYEQNHVTLDVAQRDTLFDRLMDAWAYVTRNDLLFWASTPGADRFRQWPVFQRMINDDPSRFWRALQEFGPALLEGSLIVRFPMDKPFTAILLNDPSMIVPRIAFQRNPGFYLDISIYERPDQVEWSNQQFLQWVTSKEFLESVHITIRQEINRRNRWTDRRLALDCRNVDPLEWLNIQLWAIVAPGRYTSRYVTIFGYVVFDPTLISITDPINYWTEPPIVLSWQSIPSRRSHLCMHGCVTDSLSTIRSSYHAIVSSETITRHHCIVAESRL